MMQSNTRLPVPAMTLALCSASWLAGIYIGSELTPRWPMLAAALLPLAGVPFARRRAGTLVVVAICVVLLLAGASRSFHWASSPGAGSIGTYAGAEGKVAVRGIVSEEPDVRYGSAFLRLSARQVKAGEEWRPANGTVLVKLRPYPEYNYGDTVEAYGTLKAPTSQGAWSRRGASGVTSLMDYPSVTVLASGTAPLQLQWVSSLRLRLSRSLAVALPEPHASLAQAMFLGERGTIPADINKAFSATGAMHLLAISGMNLSIMAGVLVSIAILLIGRRRFLYVWLAMAAIWLYAAITGLQPPVLRSAIMASTFLLAEYAGRPGSGITALVLAAAIMVGLDPGALWSISFQLSFVATAGLMYVSPLLGDWMKARVPPVVAQRESLSRLTASLADSLAITIGATMATWPLIAYYFGTASLVSLPVNLLLTPVIAVIMVASALTAIIGLAALSLGMVVGWATWLAIAYMLWVVGLFNSMPVASVATGSLPGLAIAAYYLMGIAALWVLSRRYANNAPTGGAMSSGRLFKGYPRSLASRAAILGVTALVLVNLGLATALLTRPDGKLHVSFMDVGSGDAILIRAPGGRTVLIDGGPDPGVLQQGLGRRLPFWRRDIDVIVLTHPHADHLTGLVEVLRRYKVGQALDSGSAYPSAMYDAWKQEITDRATPYRAAKAGQTLDLGGGAILKVLHPADATTEVEPDELDSTGMVLSLEYGQTSLLLTADITADVERLLLEQRAVSRSTVLKVAHHGSGTSTSPQFLAVVQPSLAVVSVAARDRHGLPDEEVIERLKEQVGEGLYLTSQSGTIEVVTDGRQLWLNTER